jgi:hypothetical protein
MASPPKPPKGSKYDAAANDWRAGEDEAEMAKKKAKPEKPIDRDRPIDRFLPGVNYDKEFDTYKDHRDSKKRFYTPRTSPGFKIKRNDKDLAAQSTVDYNMSGIRPKQRGGGPGQRPGIDMIDNIKYAKGGSVGSYSKMEMEHVRQMKSHGVPEKYVKQEEKEAKGMKKGGMTSCYAKGGGIERKGKTSVKMVKMASGGSVSSRADGIASKGKTKCKMR